MRSFIENVGVADAFKRAALNRPLFTKKKGVIIHIIVTQIIYNNIVAVIFRDTERYSYCSYNIALQKS